jgi:hypothetical protein
MTHESKEIQCPGKCQHGTLEVIGTRKKNDGRVVDVFGCDECQYTEERGEYATA